MRHWMRIKGRKVKFFNDVYSVVEYRNRLNAAIKNRTAKWNLNHALNLIVFGGVNLVGSCEVARGFADGTRFNRKEERLLGRGDSLKAIKVGWNQFSGEINLDALGRFPRTLASNQPQLRRAALGFRQELKLIPKRKDARKTRGRVGGAGDGRV